MVYLHFPLQLTEEEEMLQKKYQKLKRKRKALQQLKTPKLEQPVAKPAQSSTEPKPDAKEVAKKLLKSGAISAIKVENKERQGFKRPKALERKRSATDRSNGTGVTGYQPFSASHGATEETNNSTGGSSTGSPSTSAPSNYGPAVKKLYESFVSSRDTSDGDYKEDHPKERERRDRDRDGRNERPKQGNTVYVRGYGITQQILEKTFQPIGNIINISMEMDKNCGFVTFENMEDADKAIKSMNGIMVEDVQLTVSLARRQPLIPPVNDESQSKWASLAANYRQKTSNEDSNRDLVTYDDIF